MAAIIRFLINLFFRTPLEILVAILRILFLLFLVPIVLIVRFIECLIKLLRTKNLYALKGREKPCPRPLPESIVRRPDPAIYSQQLLLSQDLPVTWNNPDIDIAKASTPNVIEPDSYHLSEDTDYLVFVRVHNASTVAAIGVRVRLRYRPWSFNSPDLVPIETDPDGNEVIKYVNVRALSDPNYTPSIAKFMWHTPKIADGEEKKHFCIQAELYHPMDTNMSNNMGQENTNVYKTNPKEITPGETVKIKIPLHNTFEQATKFHFTANVYEINEKDTVKLSLKKTRGFSKLPLSGKIASIYPVLRMGNTKHGRTGIGNFGLKNRSGVQCVKTKYEGFDSYKKKIMESDFSLPTDMRVTFEGNNLDEKIELEPKAKQDLEFAIEVPVNISRQKRVPINFTALTNGSTPVGGVTIILNIKEGT